MKKNTKRTGKILRSCFATMLAVVMAVPVASLSNIGTAPVNEPVEVEAADVELPKAIMSLDFERGFKGEAEDGLKVKESKGRLVYEEYKENDNYVKDADGNWRFEWTDKPSIQGGQYQINPFGNQPTTFDDSEKGNVFRLDGSMDAELIVKTKEDEVTSVPVYTGEFDAEGKPLDMEAAEPSILQQEHTAHSAVQINNPFVGMDFTEEYDSEDPEGPLWTKGVTISYWVKVPTVEPAEGEEVDEDKILNDSVLFTFENIQRDDDTITDQYDPLQLPPDGDKVVYEVNGWIKYQAAINYSADDPMYAQGTLSVMTDMKDPEKTYEVLSDYGPLVRLTPDYPGTADRKIYFRDDEDTKTPDVTVNTVDESGNPVVAKLYELGANIYNDYKTLDTSEGSLVARGYINGSMQIAASNAFHFKEDDFYQKVETDDNGNEITTPVKGAYDINPNNKDEIGEFRQFRYYNTFYFEGDGTVTYNADKWHYVTCVIQNDWVQFYVDGEEISADSYGYHGEAFNTLNGKKYFNKGFGIRYPYQLGWTNVADWVDDGTFSSGPSNCVPQTMLEWISDEDTVLYLGYEGICAESVSQDIGTLDGALLDDITFYAEPLTAEQAVALYDQAVAKKDAQSNKELTPIKLYDFGSDAYDTIPAGMTEVATNGDKVERPAVVNEVEYGHVLKLGDSLSSVTSAVSFENPYKGMDTLEGATISYWAKSTVNDRGKMEDGLAVAFLDEPKVLVHGKIQDSVKDVPSRTGLYAELSCDAEFQAGIDTSVYGTLKNKFSTTTIKNGFTDPNKTGYDEESAKLEDEWNARLDSMSDWHYVTMVVENSGITMYFDGQKLENNQEDKYGPTFYGPRFYDGYYTTMLDSFAHIRFGTGNQTATSLMEFLTQSDTAGYFGLMYKLGSSTTYATTELSFFDDVAFYDKALSEEEVQTIYADAVTNAEDKKPVEGEPVYPDDYKTDDPDPTATPNPSEPDPDVPNKSDTQKGGFKETADGKLTSTVNGVTVTADKASIPKGTELVVTVLGKSDAAAKYTAANTSLKGAGIDAASQVITLYDIHLEVDGKTVAPTGKLTVTFTPPTGYQAAKTSIVRMSDVKSMSTSVSGSSLVFETETLGEFAVMQKKGANVTGNVSSSGSSTAGKTGDDVSVVVPVVLLAVAFCVIAVLRKKEELMEE